MGILTLRISRMNWMKMRLDGEDVVEDVIVAEDGKEEEEEVGDAEEDSKVKRPRKRRTAVDADVEISNLMMRLIKTLSLRSLMMNWMKMRLDGGEEEEEDGVGEVGDGEEKDVGDAGIAEENSKVKRPRKRRTAVDADVE